MNKTETRRTIKALKAKRKDLSKNPTPAQRRNLERIDRLIVSLETQLEKGIFPKRLTKKEIDEINKKRKADLNNKKLGI